MRKLIVIAEECELNLISKLKETNPALRDWLTENVNILITGAGATNVIEALKNVPRDTEIISIGYAGSKDLLPGRFYTIARSAIYHPNVSLVNDNPQVLNVYYMNMPAEPNNLVDCYTSNDFVLDTDMSGCVFDMELSYIVAMGFKSIWSWKYVSDNLDLSQYRETMLENETPVNA